MATTAPISLRPGEHMLAVIRRTAWPAFPVLCAIFVWFVIPFFFLFPLLEMGAIGVMVFASLVASALLYAWNLYRRWIHTCLVITDQRAVDCDQRGMFDRIVSEVEWDRVEDITYRVQGFLPTLLGYGDVRLQIAGSSDDILLSAVRDPKRVHDLLRELMRPYDA